MAKTRLQHPASGEVIEPRADVEEMYRSQGWVDVPSRKPSDSDE